MAMLFQSYFSVKGSVAISDLGLTTPGSIRLTTLISGNIYVSGFFTFLAHKTSLKHVAQTF